MQPSLKHVSRNAEGRRKGQDADSMKGREVRMTGDQVAIVRCEQRIQQTGAQVSTC